ncbi:DUF1320 domain-containing protein [Komagataeibacter xylinus]|uniref:gp436 family protein n=1 Tax=Komagataeibacter xylinus TaxID=28448 RepID=UPI00280A593F|nr:DUF1320 domain-containing protein [Komagataeibacter xylinus]
MPYAQLSDMVQRFGESELIAVTTPKGQPRERIDTDKVQAALSDASDVIDSYLRRQYALPLSTPSPALVRVCCVLARYSLNSTSETKPTEQMDTDVKRAMAWLSDIGKGNATLDGDEAPNLGTSFSRVQGRRPAYNGGAF